MLVIKARQMSQLAEQVEARYVRQTHEFLCTRYPQYAERYEAAAGAEFISAGIKKARRYKVVEAADTAVFLQYQAAFGADFENNPDYSNLKKILLIRNLKGAEKIKRMLAKIEP